jgi:3-isopropylmalate/(R)-2-methylmalate dehydratase small subunit
MRWGIRAVIGESFAEIFFGNCLALGIPCLIATHENVMAIQAAIAADPGATLVADLEALELRQEGAPGSGPRERWPLQLAAGPRSSLLSGQWDGTSQLLAHDAELDATALRLPYLNGFSANP